MRGLLIHVSIIGKVLTSPNIPFYIKSCVGDTNKLNKPLRAIYICCLLKENAIRVNEIHHFTLKQQR